MRRLSDFLTDADRKAIRAPISEARTFPQLAYHSQEFFELEVEHLCAHNWIVVEFAGSVPHVGDVAPVDIFGTPQRASTAMTHEEAYEVLGLAPGASDADIRQAHHRLMIKLHPDHGGSDYLAIKINQARDILLGA